MQNTNPTFTPTTLYPSDESLRDAARLVANALVLSGETDPANPCEQCGNTGLSLGSPCSDCELGAALSVDVDEALIPEGAQPVASSLTPCRSNQNPGSQFNAVLIPCSIVAATDGRLICCFCGRPAA